MAQKHRTKKIRDLMTEMLSKRYQALCQGLLCLSFIVSLAFCSNARASQDAIVVVDRAVIYADEAMTSPIGFVKRGKKIKVGNTPRNRNQVYPIIVSGKMAFIQVLDVSTEKESTKSDRLVAERFQKKAKEKAKTRYGLSYVTYASQINIEAGNGNLKNNDPLTWSGLSFKGELLVANDADLIVMFNFFRGEEVPESFRIYELGIGGAYRIYESSRVTLKADALLLSVPFANYLIGDEIRVNGYGVSVGAGLGLTVRVNENWGVEGYGGMYYTKLTGFNLPDTFNEMDPSFAGTRLGLGVNYQY